MEKLKELSKDLEGVTNRLNSLLEKKDTVIILTQSELRDLHTMINEAQLYNQNKAKGCTTNGQAFKEAMDKIEIAKGLRAKLLNDENN